ncbi:hypothetical protein J4456_01235 [Candidatus Pacearchaeota archaeon]|nr:hypothetical protein [Candidatus Pacearchaeota archaeon]
MDIIKVTNVIPLTTTQRDYIHIFKLYRDDMQSGDLIQESDVCIDKILSINQNLILHRVGKVKVHVIARIKKVLNSLIE